MVQVGRSVKLVYDINPLMRCLVWHIDGVVIIIIIIIVSIIRVFIVLRMWRQSQVDRSQRGLEPEAAVMLRCAYSYPVWRRADTLELRPS